uniref:Uncharacterized protein n=1 Tax=Anguilla anguilla TaxID=7936 RepID=A0A0E9QLG8_ANGAN
MSGKSGMFCAEMWECYGTTEWGPVMVKVFPEPVCPKDKHCT